MNVNQMIYMSTPNLRDSGLHIKRKIVQKFEFIRCKKGQILETEGEKAWYAYIVVKGQVKIYKKIINDELNDDNKGR
jgi:CRP-like cAMP-binding protein